MLQIANERVQKQLWSHFSGLPTDSALLHGPQNGLFRWPGHARHWRLRRGCSLIPSPVLPRSDRRGHRGSGQHGTARRAEAEELLHVASRLAALELIVSARAVDLRGKPSLGKGTKPAYDCVRSFVPAEEAGWRRESSRSWKRCDPAASRQGSGTGWRALRNKKLDSRSYSSSLAVRRPSPPRL